MDDGAGGGTNVDAKANPLTKYVSIFMKTNLGFYAVSHALQFCTQVPLYGMVPNEGWDSHR